MPRDHKRARVIGALATALSCSLSLACVDETNFYTLDGPTTIRYFIVFDADAQPLWRLSAPGTAKLGRVKYGQIPTGLVQEVPSGSVHPRPLRKGEKLVVVIITPTTAYRHEGQATGPDEFLGGYGETSPLRGDKLERALRGQPITDPA